MLALGPVALPVGVCVAVGQARHIEVFLEGDESQGQGEGPAPVPSNQMLHLLLQRVCICCNSLCCICCS